MAASLNSREDEESIESTVNEWLLDFACYTAWKEFREKGAVDAFATRDLIQGVLCRPLKNSSVKKSRVQLLLILCKLSDGEDYDARYTSTSNLTVLEEVLASFDSIIKGYDTSSNVRMQSAKHRVAIMTQAVYVCCRAGDFDLAKEVFDRQWSDPEETEKAKKSVIQAVLKSKNSKHKDVMKETYRSFLDIMQNFLHLIIDTHEYIEEPFLLKLARAYAETERRENMNQTPRKRRKLNLQDIKTISAHEGILVDNENITLPSNNGDEFNKKLDRYRNKTVNGIVTAALQDRNNSNMDDESGGDDDDSPDTDRGSHSSDSRSPGRDHYSKHKSKSPSERRKLLLSTQKTRKRLAKTTEALRKTVHGVQAVSSSPQSNNSKRKGSVKSSDSGRSGEETPRSRYRDQSRDRDISNRSRDGSSRSPHTSPSNNLQKFRYRKNVNRKDRHVYDMPSSDDMESVDLTDEEYSDDEVSSRKQIRLEGQPKVWRSLQPKSRRVKRKGGSRKFWTPKEEEEFYNAVQEFGVGNWTNVKTYLQTFRSSVDLKDKWRNLERCGKMKTLSKKFGKVV
ncbi:myb-like protein F isoform X2 [Haliotis rubra]|uniref:myb-like protein F isoform X2 n=1 Tax=Haliotis rubra TaxID=36100 RepID=UPI001EE576B5|nr:myb-like protein F isoform X2 [Haliotis rubra]